LLRAGPLIVNVTVGEPKAPHHSEEKYNVTVPPWQTGPLFEKLGAFGVVFWMETLA
jgi:hypothetical protein